MNFKKLTALLLAMLICVCAFAACANTEKNDDEKKDDEKKDEETTVETVSITIKDQSGNVICSNTKLDIDPATDGENGKFYISDVLEVAAVYDTKLSFEYDEEKNSINFIKYDETTYADVPSVTEKEIDMEKSVIPEEGDTETEEQIVYKDVEYCYFWSVMVGEKEVSTTKEINLGDVITLVYNKVPVSELEK